MWEYKQYENKAKRKKLLLCFQLSFLCLSPCMLTFLFQSLYYFLQLLIRFHQIIFWLRKWGKLELDIIYLLPKQKIFFSISEGMQITNSWFWDTGDNAKWRHQLALAFHWPFLFVSFLFTQQFLQKLYS